MTKKDPQGVPQWTRIIGEFELPKQVNTAIPEKRPRRPLPEEVWDHISLPNVDSASEGVKP